MDKSLTRKPLACSESGQETYGNLTMNFPCTVSQLPNGRWSIRYVGADVDKIEVTAGTKQEALEKMRGELRYRLELCPCTGETYQHLVIEITD